MTDPPGTEWLRRVFTNLTSPAILPVVAAVLIGGLVALAAANYERTRPSVYQSTTVLLLDSPLAITSNPGTVIAVSEIRAKYVGLIGTDVIAQPAATKLGLPLAQVAGAVTASLAPSSLDIVLRARGSSPDRSEHLAAAVAQSLIDYVHAEQAALPLVNPQLRLTMQVVGKAYPGYRVSPNHRREIATGAIFGLVALAAVYVLGRAAVELGRRAATG